MSEYQYYEFQTADRRLSEKEMQELRSYSTRAVITPTSFSNEYSFGSFNGNPNAWMERYFDGFVYLANWGSREFHLALPAKLLSAETARLYCAGPSASVREKSGKLILTFQSEEEAGGEWIQGEGILSSLLPLRADLTNGDLRSLYVGWLLNVQSGELEEKQTEPPVPPNLGEFFSPLSKLVDFLRNRSRTDGTPAPEASRRTVRELLAAAEAFRTQRQRKETRNAADEKARQEHLAAIARQKHLEALAGRESGLWTKVDGLVTTKLPKSYDLALQHLVDLRDLAILKGQEAGFSRRLAQLREAHARKPSFLSRLRDNGL